MKGRRKSQLSGWWNAPPVWMSLLFVIDLYVGSSKTAPGLAADGILQMVWNKRPVLGPFVPVCFDPCCRGEQRNVGCRWAALQSPVCVTSQRIYSSALEGLAPSQAVAAGIAQRFPVKPLGFWLKREHWEWRILTKAFQGLFSTALLSL